MRPIDADAFIAYCDEKWIPLNVDAVNAQPTIEPSANCSEIPNNSDTISRQDAIDALKVAYWDKNIQSAKDDPCIVDAMTDWAIRQIKALPSAQPERKKGKWHRRFYPQIEMMVCSECQEEFSYDAETGIRDYNYCPNCGADMRGEQDDS